MKRRIPFLVLAGTALALVGGPLAAQQPGAEPQPARGAPLTAPSPLKPDTVVAARALPSGHSVIEQRWRTQPARAAGQLDALRASETGARRGGHFGTGALLGALIGGGVGALVGVHQYDVCQRSSGWFKFCGGEVPVLGLIGAAVGAAVGSFIAVATDTDGRERTPGRVAR